MVTDKTKIMEVLTRGVETVLPDKEALAKLMSEKQITLYQGFDPSMPSLHLGNFVGLMKLRQFQKLGHKVIFLVGDFTGMIGDPSGKSSTRKPLTRQQVLNNSKLYKSQASKILRFHGENPAEIRYNSEWLDKLTPEDFYKYTSNLTYQQVIERDMFQKRINEGKDIYINEFLYPFLQGYDSVAMKVDLEIGGSDQIFNMLMGRKLMRNILKKEKYVLATKLLVDKDGQKVGKTTGNALFLDSTPDNFYGGVMSFPDEVIYLAFELLTECDLRGLSEKIKDPMQEKKKLAFEIVKLLWGEENAKSAQMNFENTFQKGNPPENSQTFVLSKPDMSVIDLLVDSKIIKSKSEAKRLFDQKAIEKNGVKIDIKNKITITDTPITLKIGKTKFLKVVSK